MRNQIFKVGLLFLIAALNWRCSVYTPVLPKAPLFSEKKELQANINLQNIGGISGNLAYSFSNHFAVLVNSSAKFNGKKTHSNFYHYQQNEIGLGYFSKIRKSENWVFELYGGLGQGKTEYKSPEAFYLLKSPINEIRYFKADNNNFFGQVTVGFIG